MFFNCIFHNSHKHLIIYIILVYFFPPDSSFHHMVNCTRIPYPLFSCYKSYPFPFLYYTFVVFINIIIYDSL